MNIRSWGFSIFHSCSRQTQYTRRSVIFSETHCQRMEARPSIIFMDSKELEFILDGSFATKESYDIPQYVQFLLFCISQQLHWTSSIDQNQWPLFLSQFFLVLSVVATMLVQKEGKGVLVAMLLSYFFVFFHVSETNIIYISSQNLLSSHIFNFVPFV